MKAKRSKMRQTSGGTVPFLFNIPTESHKNLKLLATIKGQTMRSVLVEMIEQYVQQNQKGIRAQ